MSVELFLESDIASATVVRPLQIDFLLQGKYQQKSRVGRST